MMEKGLKTTQMFTLIPPSPSPSSTPFNQTQLNINFIGDKADSVICFFFLLIYRLDNSALLSIYQNQLLHSREKKIIEFKCITETYEKYNEIQFLILYLHKLRASSVRALSCNTFLSIKCVRPNKLCLGMGHSGTKNLFQIWTLRMEPLKCCK